MHATCHAGLNCLVHAAACHEHSDHMAGFGVGLSWQQLRPLRLCSKAANDALLSVCSYLRAHTRPGLELFSQQAPTLAMALLVAQDSASYQFVLQHHQAAAAARKQAHWVEVQRKQAAAAQELQNIGQLTVDLGPLREELCDARTDKEGVDSYERRHKTSVWKAAVRRFKNAQHAVDSKQSQLYSAEQRRKEALKPPDFIVHPLPEGESAAYQVTLNGWLIMASRWALPVARKPVVSPHVHLVLCAMS